MVIGVWGASITYGVGDREALGWPGRLLKAKYQGDDLHVHNRGIPGNTTRDLLHRFKSELDSINPDVVFLSIGMNDSKLAKDETESVVPLDEYRNNVSELIYIARAYTDKIIVAGLTNVQAPLITPRGSHFSNELVEPYNAILEEVSKKEGLQYIPLFGIFDPETDFSDGLHPNATGYDKMANKILDSIKL